MIHTSKATQQTQRGSLKTEYADDEVNAVQLLKGHHMAKKLKKVAKNWNQYEGPSLKISIEEALERAHPSQAIALQPSLIDMVRNGTRYYAIHASGCLTIEVETN